MPTAPRFRPPAPGTLSDPGIRAALLRHLRATHREDATTAFLEELGLCDGSSRADVAVVNGALAGFEIKSDRDTLDRLARQRALYNRVFDVITVVTVARHLDAVRRRVPRWWGIVHRRLLTSAAWPPAPTSIGTVFAPTRTRRRPTRRLAGASCRRPVR